MPLSKGAGAGAAQLREITMNLALQQKMALESFLLSNDKKGKYLWNIRN